MASSIDFPRYLDKPVPKKVQSIFEQRLKQFTDTGGQYHDLYLPKFYDYDRKSGEDNVKLEVYSVPKLKRPLFKEALKDAEWKPAKKGQSFGPSWATHWFKIAVKIPESWNSSEGPILFEWNSNDEGMLYYEDGTAIQGLSGEHNRKEWAPPAKWRDNEWHTFYIETACNNIQGLGSPPPSDRYFRLDRADLVLPNVEARALYIDFWIIGDAAREFPGDSWQKHKARELCNRIMDTFDPNSPDSSIAECRKLAQQYIGENVDTPEVYDSKNRHEVLAVGNCHIDTAWLWPYAETRRKIARSWASQLRLIERYPEYVFVASQMQQFKWLLEDHPELFKEVQEAVKGGRFIPIGGTWVECDTNMPSGESLSRQFLLGQRFLQQHFNMKTKTFWLPDTFGYSPQIPQLCRLADQDRFLTQKLSWNNVNQFPNSTFSWVALDGSQVVVHMPPDNTYTAAAHFGDVSRALHQHKNLDIDQTGLLLFGYGDGGGGPNDEMLQKLRRCRGISDNAGLLPRVHSGNTIDDFYDNILKNTNNGKDLVSWSGELYLEYHRGTYTTQAAIKKGNRYSEVLMHDLELVATIASLKVDSYEYPKKDIDSLWEDICLNQFHDVLPGSGIEMIYDDARAIYKSVMERGKNLLNTAFKALGFADHLSDKAELNLLNTMPWGRAEVVELPKKSGHASNSLSKAAVQEEQEAVALAQCGPGGFAELTLSSASTVPKAWVEEPKPGVFVLQNDKLRVTVKGGGITSIWDLETNREIVAEGSVANQLVILKDTPLSFPAWDTELYSLENRSEVSPGEVSIVKNGPLRATVAVVQNISDKSSIRTEITLDAYIKPKDDATPDVSLIQFACEVDWHETYKFLKVEFPVDIRSANASYETSYGYHQRPTHYNTSWDVAKFEVCGHKWADLSDYSYGVSILNESKYGYSIHGNVMTLSLLRSPKSPDANADMGVHEFRYALLPHKGGLSPDVVKAAYNFNYPLQAVYTNPPALSCKELGTSLADELPELHGAQDASMNVTAPSDDDGFTVFKTFQVIGDESLVFSALKRFEDDKDISTGALPIRGTAGTKSVIIRVYDALGGTARGYITSSLTVAKAFKTNILEEDQDQIDILNDLEHDKIPIELKPFEVATYRLELEL